MKILVIDDSKTSLLVTQTSLEGFGHQVLSADDPSNGIVLFEKESPDLIILDVLMHGMSGYECAKKIRTLENDDEWVPIIFLSAQVDDEAIEKGIESGGDDYLCKPFSEITLRAKILAMERISKMRHELVDAKKHLSTLSSTDTLTGIANRRKFRQLFTQELSKLSDNSNYIAILLLDLDKFKIINDTYGHELGDELLQSASKRILTTSGSDCHMARLGGDEFVLMLPDIKDPIDAAYLSKKVINVLSMPFNLSKTTVHIGVSIGIACYPMAGTSLSTLLRHADIALYRVKNTGRNNFQFYTKELQKKHDKTIEVETLLVNAIKNKEFNLVYQPKFNLKDRKCVGFEALLRWNLNDKSLSSPDVFIPIAEKSGLIVQIGYWVIEQAFSEFSKLISAGFKGYVLAINMSPEQIRDQHFITHLKALMEKYPINPRYLEFEITETSIISDSNKTVNVLNTLHNLGIKLTIDDFGTGYSSLTHIKQLPIDSLKIDKDFVLNMVNDKDNESIVDAVISLSDSLNLDVVAEGVETEAHCQMLLGLNCHTAQGFYLSKPLSLEDLQTFLTRSNT